MGMTMAPPYTGYPMSGSSVVPVGSMAAPMMMVPSYGLPGYSQIPAYGSPVQVTTVPNPGRAAVARPKPLTEEASSALQKQINKSLSSNDS